MPTLNIDVNARTERAKRDLKALDIEILKLSDSEKILNKSLAKSGTVGAQAFKQISSAAVRQAKAVNSAAGQFRQLRSQLQAAGAAPQVIGRLTQSFVNFRKVMERGTVASLKFQRTQDKFSNTLRTTARQFKLLSGEVKDATNATTKLNAINKANQAALAKQAHALSNAKIQYKQLVAQMRRLGASKTAIRGTTRAFVAFRKEMKMATLSSRDLQRSQDRLKTSFAGTRRQLAKTTAATNKFGTTAKKGKRSVTGLGTTLENLGSTAVLVMGPLSGIGSRLIAFGAIAKRGSILSAGLFSVIAGAGVFISKAIKAFDELNLSLSKTKAILKATGKEAHITSELVEEAASRIARRTLANLEETRPTANILLASKGINAGNLEEMLGLSQDVAASGLMELTNIAKLISRTLEDPAANMEAFRRALVQLTPLEKDQVIHLQNIGKGAEAAAISINKLKNKFGGVGESQNIGLAGALDGLGQSWTKLLEDFGEGAAYRLAIRVVKGLAKVLDRLVELRVKIRELASDFKNLMQDAAFDHFGIGEPSSKEVPEKIKPLEITVTKPNIIKGDFEKALIDANTGIKKSLINLHSEREKAEKGFATLSPKILSLAQKHKVLSEVLQVTAGDFSDLNVEGRRVFAMAVEVNEAFKDLERRKEAETIFNDTRTALFKYNKELNHLIFLNDNGYISIGNLILKQKELRATLESSTPELNALTSASEKFGDSLSDLIIKGENFSEGLKSIFKSLVDDILKQFLKLAVINPVLNGIFGASSNRPRIGSQGGGKSGLGGAGGLLGMAVSGIGELFGKTTKGTGGERGSISSSVSSNNLPIPLPVKIVGSSAPGFGGTGGEGDIGGGEGLFEKIISEISGLFGKSNKDAPAEVFNGVVKDFGKTGTASAEKYGETLDKTNAKIGEKGTKAATAFGNIFADMASGLASAAGGAVGSFLGHAFADLLGFQHGGSFKVGGSGGRDSQLVAFKASPREKVSVETPGQQKGKGGGNVTYIDARGADPGQMDRLIQIVKDLDESVEVRAVNATADARDRNPSLFGRIS